MEDMFLITESQARAILTDVYNMGGSDAIHRFQGEEVSRDAEVVADHFMEAVKAFGKINENLKAVTESKEKLMSFGKDDKPALELPF